MDEIKVQKVKLGDVNHMLNHQIQIICDRIKDSYLKEVDMISGDDSYEANYHRGRASAFEYSMQSLSIMQKQIKNLLT